MMAMGDPRPHSRFSFFKEFIEAVVSVKRLSSFLNADELQTDARVVIEKPNLQLGDEVRQNMRAVSSSC